LARNVTISKLAAAAAGIAFRLLLLYFGRKKEEKSCDLASSMGVVFVYLFSFERIFLLSRPHHCAQSIAFYCHFCLKYICFIQYEIKSEIR
jgi:hypothetical protein